MQRFIIGIWKLFTFEFIINLNKVPLLQNLVVCTSASQCSGGQNCTYLSTADANVCSCTSDRWWNPAILYCRK